MRWLKGWAVAIVGTGVLCASSCLTSQESAGDDGGVEDPPVTNGRGGSGGRNPRGGAAGEDTGGTSQGGRAGTSGTGTGEGGADGCGDDDDCASRIDGRPRCSVPTGDCVECLDVTDCEAGEECVNNACRPITTCTTADDCPRGVCNPTTARCVECVGSSGCSTGELCVSNTCRQSCTTDSQCILFGLRCDRSANYCASCVSHADCPSDRNCQAGTCVRDICTGGAASCNGNVLTTCNAAGSALSNPTPCGARQTCAEDRSGARCEDWICEPGTTGCHLTEERVVSCSEDGLTETVEEDCAAVDQLCIGTVGGVCADVACEPSMRFCQANTIQQCDTAGTTFTLYQTCTTGLLCNPATVTCATPLCTPGQPACDGNVYTTCNAQGFGYTGARTDCAATMEFCGLTGCTASAVDTIPAMPTLYTGTPLPNYMMVNLYSVTGSRNLSLIEVYMSPTAATTLNWHVYESTTQTGTYTSISNTATTSTTGTGYQASGALAVPLVAGRFYAIGVSWTTPALQFGYQIATASQAVSFGNLFGVYLITPPPAGTTIVPSITTSTFIPQRLTTAP